MPVKFPNKFSRLPLFFEKGETRRGYLLIESMVAITVVVVGLLGIFALLSQALGLNRVVADRYVASYLAAEGIEIVKNIIDDNVLAGRAWNDGLADGRYQLDYAAEGLGTECGSSCPQLLYFDPNRKLYSYAAGGRKTNFNRVITITALTDSEGLAQAIRVSSRVQWTTRGSGEFALTVEDHFYNYR